MEEIKKNDVVVSLKTQRTSSSYCEIEEGYINKAHNISFESNVIWFNETPDGLGSYPIENFRLATEEECKLFEEKGAHVLNMSPSLEGRWLKALKNGPQCTNFLIGEYALIKSGSGNCVTLDRKGYIANLNREDDWELMPEGFISPVEKEKYKEGDYVVCIGEENMSKLGVESSGWEKNLCFVVKRITTSLEDTQILWEAKDGSGVYEDQVRMATKEEGDEHRKQGKNYDVTSIIKSSQKSSEYKAGDWVMMTEDYVEKNVKKGCIYRLIRRQTVDSSCWVVDHEGPDSFLAPYEHMFRLAEPHEIHPGNSATPLVFTTSGNDAFLNTSTWHHHNVERYRYSSGFDLYDSPSPLPELVKVVGVVNNVPHQEPKILRKNKKKRKLVIVNQ